MKTLRLLLAASLLAPLLAHADFAGTTLSLDANGLPQVRFPAGSHPFAVPDSRFHREVREPFWKRDSRCVTLDARSVTVSAEAECAGSAIAIDDDERPRDRMYPAVVRLRGGGVLVFAAYLQTIAGPRIAPIRLEAPPAGVAAFRNRVSTSSLVVAGSEFSGNSGGWIYLGPDRFVDEGIARVLVDDGLLPEQRGALLDLAPRLARVYQSRLGLDLPAPPTFYLTWLDRESPGRSSQADVVPGEIRFSVYGSGWKDAPDAASAQRFRELVAHEIAHLWVPPGPKFSGVAPWVTEGHAELLSVAGLLGTGTIDAAQAARRVQDAMLECALQVGSRAWVAVPERNGGRAPYVCGLALQFAIVAAAHASDASVDALSYWRRLQEPAQPMYEAMFAREALNRGDARLAARLQLMLTSRDVPFIPALRTLLAAAKVEVREEGELSAALQASIGGRVLAAAMGSDCNGSYGFFNRGDHFLVDRLECSTLKPDMRLVAIEGHSLFDAPVDAARAARAACDREQGLTLQTLEGASVRVACGADAAGRLPGTLTGVRLEPSQVKAIFVRD